MEVTVLDLRTERCPMALLLAKRHAMALLPEQQSQILISDLSSLSDIENFLHRQAFDVRRQEKGRYYCLQVTKGPLLNV